MSYSRDKLAAFEQAVEQEAEQKIKQLQEEAKAYREQELKKQRVKNMQRCLTICRSRFR